MVLALVGCLHRQSVRMHPYRDDWFMPIQSKSVLTNTFSYLGHFSFISDSYRVWRSFLIPAQDVVFLGMRLRTDFGFVCPTQDRVDRLLVVVNSFRGNSSIPANHLLEAIGMMVPLLAFVPWVRLRLRPFLFCPVGALASSMSTFSRVIPVRPSLRVLLWWWINAENLFKGASLRVPPCTEGLFTDASTTGWGAHLDELTTQVIGLSTNGSITSLGYSFKRCFLALQCVQQSVPN